MSQNPPCSWVQLQLDRRWGITTCNRILPSIPRGSFLRCDSLQLADKFLAASANGLSEFGERAAARQAAESIRSGAPVPRTGPAGMTVACSTERPGCEHGERKDQLS